MLRDFLQISKKKNANDLLNFRAMAPKNLITAMLVSQ